MVEILHHHDGEVDLECVGHSLGGDLALILAACTWFQSLGDAMNPKKGFMVHSTLIGAIVV